MKEHFLHQVQACPLTLGAALDEYFRGHPGLLHDEGMDRESAPLFRSHDVCHVVFGLDTELPDEVLADAQTVLGTNVGWRRYARYLS